MLTDAPHEDHMSGSRCLSHSCVMWLIDEGGENIISVHEARDLHKGNFTGGKGEKNICGFRLGIVPV